MRKASNWRIGIGIFILNSPDNLCGIYGDKMADEFITIQELKENMGAKEEPKSFGEMHEMAKETEWWNEGFNDIYTVYDGTVYICKYCGATKHPNQLSACEHSNSSYIEYTAKLIPKEKTKEIKGRKLVSFIGHLFFIVGWIALALCFSEGIPNISYPLIIISIGVTLDGIILMWKSRRRI